MRFRPNFIVSCAATCQVTDLDFNKEMAICDREIHKIFYFSIVRCDFWVLGITEQ